MVSVQIVNRPRDTSSKLINNATFHLNTVLSVINNAAIRTDHIDNAVLNPNGSFLSVRILSTKNLKSPVFAVRERKQIRD